MRSVHRMPPRGARIHCSLTTIALSPLDATLTKNRGWGYLPICERSEHYPPKPLLLNSFVFRFLRPLFHDGVLLSVFFSMASALFPSRRGGRGTQSHIASHQPAPTVSGSQFTPKHARGTSEAPCAALSSSLDAKPDHANARYPWPSSHLRGLRPLRPLRPLPQRLSHLSPLEPRSRFAPWPHPPNDPGRVAPASHHRIFRRSHRQMPRLPRLRNCLPLRRRIWKTRRALPRAHRTRLSPLLARHRHAQLRFPPPAPRSASHHRRRTRSSLLPTLRLASHRAQHRYSETSRSRRARTSPPAHRRQFFLPPPWLDVSCCRSAPRPRRLLRWMHRQRHFFAAQRSHHPRPHRQRLRSRRPKRSTLLRRARGARRRSRCRSRTRAKESLRISSRRLRCHHHQRRRLRFHAQGIPSSLLAKRGRARPGTRIGRQDSRRHRISRRSWSHCKNEAASHPRHVPGFLPSSPRTKNPRGSAYAPPRHSQSRFCRIALLGNLLRLRRRLQRNANRGISRTTRRKNAPRPIHSRPNHRHRQPRLPSPTSRRRRHPPHQPGGPPRCRTPRSQHATMKTRSAGSSARRLSLLRYFLTSSFLRLQKRLHPSRSDGGSCEKGVPSSGEKSVCRYSVVRGRRRRRLLLVFAAAVLPERMGLFHREVGGHRKTRRIRLRPLYVRQPVGRFAAPRIAPLTHDHHLQIVGDPGLMHDEDRLLISDLTRGNRAGQARSLRAHSRDRLRAQIFLFEIAGVDFLLLVGLQFSLERTAHRSLHSAKHMAHLLRNLGFGMKHEVRVRDWVVDHHERLRLPGSRQRAKSRNRNFLAKSSLAVTEEIRSEERRVGKE